MEPATDETTVSGVTNHLEGLVIGGEHVDGETTAVEISSSKPDTSVETYAELDAGADAEEDAASHVSCECCKTLTSRPCDGSFVDMAVRFWPATDEKRAGTRRLLFSLGVGVHKDHSDQLSMSVRTQGVTYDDDGDLCCQDTGDFRDFFKRLREENESNDVRRAQLDALSKEVLQLEESLRTDKSKDESQREGPESEGGGDYSDALIEKFTTRGDLVAEQHMRLAHEIIQPWKTMGSTDEHAFPSLVLAHLHQASKHDALDNKVSLPWKLGEGKILATTTYIPGSDEQRPSVRLVHPKLEGGEVTYHLSDIQDLAGEWLDSSARKLRTVADKVISQEAERGQKLEVDIAIDLASMKDVLSGHPIPGQRERVQLWDPERPTKSVSAAHPSTSLANLHRENVQVQYSYRPNDFGLNEHVGSDGSK